MTRKMKAVLILFISCSICYLLIYFYNEYNVHITEYSKAKKNVIAVKKVEKSTLYKVTYVKKNKESIELFFNLKEDKPITIIVNYLPYKHRIFINNKLVSQNISQDEAKFSNNIDFKAFTIEEDSELRVEGKGVKGTTHFYGDEQSVAKIIQIRTFISSFYCAFLLLMGCVYLSMFYFARKKVHFLIMGIMCLLTILKIVLRGDLSFLATSLATNIEINRTLHVATGVVWMICPIVATAYFFDIKLKARSKVFLISTAMLLIISMFFFSYSYNNIYFIAFLVPVYLYILLFGIYNNKPMWVWVIIANVLMNSNAAYKALISSTVYKTGTVNFITYIPVNGMVIFITIFLMLSIAEHIKELKALREKEMALEKLQLARDIGHDLKMPLSVIKSSNQIVAKYPLNQEQQNKYLKRSINAINHVEQMVQNISDFINESVNDCNSQEVISIKEAFHRIELQLNTIQFSEQSKMRFSKNEEDANIRVNYYNLYRIILNLVNNALKYTDKEAKILVKYDIKDKVYVSVKDNGIGIDEKDIKKIFNPFFRSNSARTIEGMGIGLSVVKNIMDAVDGKIEVKSKVNEGTEFTLIFNKYNE